VPLASLLNIVAELGSGWDHGRMRVFSGIQACIEARGGIVVKALRYKLAGRGLDS